MNVQPVRPEDQALIDAATALIKARYKVGRHHIAAALRTRSGRIFTGLHLDTYVGRASVCAEAVAVGQAMAAGAGEEDPIEAIVSLRHPRPTEKHREIQIVAPCGICREMLRDFAPEARVLLATEGGLTAYSPADLLPLKYQRVE
ncbi:cytidine deaminase [uncultured Ferrovibrio sp.]|jgi:cytidine deaminase|uniref:cytidine deaminase n=1 Tax=uncultured Ferrovibrio sp. TaxID=1576913 RepID=UPI002616A7CA|nr:cytidine deaminase [uncultured Ferrovibrio sp.]